MTHVARVGLGTVAGLVVLLSGCSSEPEPSVAGFADATVITQEYEDTVASLELPEGSTWPSTSFDNDAYSTGYGAERAYEIWRCHWAREAVHSDGADRSTAMDQLTGYLDSDHFASADAAHREIFEKAVRKAGEGSDQGLNDFLETSCDGLVEP